MTTTQGWMLIGVPALVLGLVLYALRSPRLGAAGMLVITAGAVALSVVDRASGAALGTVVALLHAAGRAGSGAVAGDDPAARQPPPGTED